MAEVMKGNRFMENRSLIIKIMIILGSLAPAFYALTAENEITNTVGFILFLINIFLFGMYCIEAKHKKPPVELNSILLELLERDGELKQLLHDGKKMKAIKKCRSITGCDLVTALEYVDSRM